MDLNGHDGLTDHIAAIRQHLDRLSGSLETQEVYDHYSAMDDLRQLDEITKHVNRIREIVEPLA